jgi:hypothetical protein
MKKEKEFRVKVHDDEPFPGYSVITVTAYKDDYQYRAVDVIPTENFDELFYVLVDIMKDQVREMRDGTSSKKN